MSGWVRTSRSIIDHPLFAGEAFSKRDAWQWIIIKAAWKETSHRIGNDLHDVPRGSVFVTVRQLMSEWKWGNTKVSGFLKALEKQDMVQIENKTGKTLITVCNYSKYQDANDFARQEQDAEQDSGKTAARQEQDTKERNKQNNNNKTTLPDARAMCAALGITDETKSVGLLSLSEPIHWLSSGCDMEMDILPTLRQMAARGKVVTSWAYCSKAVFEARDKRLAPRPEITTPIQGASNGYRAKPKSVAAIAMERSRQAEGA